ncbi:MAG: DUF2232 domain-containing protein [Deltaproteobacteria bacterium]|nr:DUF2232 domain-containing protein [Deltaproteobacteria bacterium]MBI4374301.1 DUF2232 domain-containing protein [Deltaproteobacteria bacterium]
MLLSLLVTLSSSILLFGSGFFNLFTPIPFSSLLVRRGWIPALLASFFALVILSGVYVLSRGNWPFLPAMVLYPYLGLSQVASLALLSFVYYAWIGFALVEVGRKKMSWGKGVGKIVLSTALVSLLGLLVSSHFFDLRERAQGSLGFIIEKIFELNPKITPEEKAFMTGPFTDTLWHLLPSFWILMTSGVVAMNILIVRRWVSPALFSGWGDFSVWRLEERVIWGPIGLGLFYLLGQFFPALDPFSWITLNLLIVVGTLYFFQGLSIFLFFLKKWLTPFMRMAVLFLMMTFLQPLALFLVLVGLFDFWFDFRKLKKMGGVAP